MEDFYAGKEVNPTTHINQDDSVMNAWPSNGVQRS